MSAAFGGQKPHFWRFQIKRNFQIFKIFQTPENKGELIQGGINSRNLVDVGNFEDFEKHLRIFMCFEEKIYKTTLTEVRSHCRVDSGLCSAFHGIT